MRNISFNNFVELEINGNISSKAVTLGDVDNDNNIELIFGTTNGKLLIFKYIQNTFPWAIAVDLGMIVCVVVGDICNQGMNIVITLSVDGLCHFFIIKSKDDFVEQKEQSPVQLIPVFKQKLPANIKVCLIVDIDNDGLNELVIGYTDRVVRYFKWVSNQTFLSKNINGTFVEQEKWTLAGQIGSISATQNKKGIWKVMVSQPGGSYVTLVISGSSSSDNHTQKSLFFYHDVSSFRTQNSDVSSEIICDINRQPFASSLGLKPCQNNSTLNTPITNMQVSTCTPPSFFPITPLLPSSKLYAQTDTIPISSNNFQINNSQMQDCNICTQTRHLSITNPLTSFNINKLSDTIINNSVEPISSKIESENKTLSSTINPVNNHPNSNISTTNQSLAGNKQIEYSMKYFAICTLDGTLNLLEEDNLVWSLCVDHQLFSIKKLDVTGDGAEEVVVCSWDGKTYIVNLSKDVIRFQFRESVAAFHAGIFSIYKDAFSPCLIYITFNNKALIYYNVSLPSIRCQTMLTSNIFSNISFEDKDISSDKRNKLIRSLLYNYY